MAKLAIVTRVASCAVNKSRNGIAVTVQVTYGDNTTGDDEEQYVEVGMPMPDALAVVGTVSRAIRDAVIANQPRGFTLTTADVLVPQIEKGSLL